MKKAFGDLSESSIHGVRGKETNGLRPEKQEREGKLFFESLTSKRGRVYKLWKSK